jgi:hypothetical protein
MVQLDIVRNAQCNQRLWKKVGNYRAWSARGVLLPLGVACSGEAEVEENASDQEATSVEVADETEPQPLLVDSLAPDPSMFFGESPEEQGNPTRAR